MNRILFITYQFPPFSGSHATRTLNIANELSKDNEVIVLTVEVNENMRFYDLELKNKLNSNLKIYRTKMGYLHKTYYENSNFKKNNQTKINIILKKIKKQMLVPDTAIDWYPIALKKGEKLIKKYKPNKIISSATPYTNHLIGYKLSKNSNIPLFLDYGDPWVYEKSVKRGRIRFFFEKYLEKKILKKAEHIFVTTENTKKLYLKEFQLKEEKVSVAYMGFNKEDFKIEKEVTNSKLIFIYGGSLNPLHRNPLPFFEAISILDEEIKNNIIVEIYTDDEKLYKEVIVQLDIEDIVKFKKIINHNKFMNLLKSRDILLLFGNSNNLQIPGKIFNYIGSLTNILLINNQENILEDETNQIIRSFENNFLISNSKNDILKILQKIFYNWKNSLLKKNSKIKSENYLWENTLKIIKEKLR